MKRLFRTIFLLPVMFVLGFGSISACNQQKQAEGVLAKITPPAAPEQGKATVVGQIIDINTGEPMSEVTVRLAEVYRDEKGGGAFVLNHYASPGMRTDKNGYFVFANIPAREYVVAVGEGDNYNAYDIIEDGTKKEAKVWTAVADQISDWGIIKARNLFR